MIYVICSGICLKIFQVYDNFGPQALRPLGVILAYTYATHYRSISDIYPAIGSWQLPTFAYMYSYGYIAVHICNMMQCLVTSWNFLVCFFKSIHIASCGQKAARYGVAARAARQRLIPMAAGQSE